ncbi:MAG: SpoIIE family protein phosphatase [Candidatus Omnitrophica bacterium]|nr:SpoIIE family protein phosphatase [Candidatus Omnitrophota bacterium]
MKSIRIKLLLGTLLMVLISLGVAGTLSYFTTKGVIERRLVLEEFKRTLDSINRDLDTLFYEREKDGRELASIPLFERWFFHEMIQDTPGADENRHAIEIYLLRFQKENPYYRQIQFIGLDGKTRIRVYLGKIYKEQLDRSDKEYFQGCLALKPGEIYVSPDVTMSEDGSSHIIYFGIGMFDASGERRGMLTGEYDFLEVQKLVRRVRIGEGGYAFLVDREGYTIAHASENLEFTFNPLKEGNPSVASMIKKMIAGETGYVKYMFRGVKKFGFFRPFSRFGWSLGIGIPVKEYEKDIVNLRNRSLAILFFTLLLAFISANALSRSITKPIIKMSETAEKIGAGSLDLKVEYKRNDEIGALARSFNKMTDNLKVYIKQLEETTREKERIATELSVAAEVQRSILPKEAPKLDYFELYGLFSPARECGGDFFNYFKISESKTGLVIADASGKGLPASLYMLQAQNLINVYASQGAFSPAKVLELANNFVCKNVKISNMFITVFFGVLDESDRTLTYSSAGHNPPLLLRENGTVERLLATGIPIGVYHDHEISENKLKLVPGDILVLYTDGVTEALNVSKDAFGVERFKEVIYRSRGLSAQGIATAVRDEVLAYSGLRGQFDDIAILVVKSLSKSASSF